MSDSDNVVVEDDPKLPVPVPKVKLEIEKIAITKDIISDLRKKYKELPDAKTKDGMTYLKAGRKEIKDLRIGARSLMNEVKKKVKALTKDFVDIGEKAIAELIEIESPMDELIKVEEDRVKEERQRKKKERAAKDRIIDEKIQDLKQMPIKFINSLPSEIKQQIETVEALEFSKDIFLDRVQSAEMAREMTIESLEQMHESAIQKIKAEEELKEQQAKLDAEKEKADKDLKEREDKLAADKSKADDERVEQKRIDDIKDKIKGFDDYLVKAATSNTVEEIGLILNQITSMSISESDYGDLFNIAEKKRHEVADSINQILTSKINSSNAEKDAKAEREKLENEKAELEKELEEKQRKEDDEKEQPKEPEAVEAPEDEDRDPSIIDPDFEAREDEDKPIVKMANDLQVADYVLVMILKDGQTTNLLFEEDQILDVKQSLLGKVLHVADGLGILIFNVDAWKLFKAQK